MFLGRQLLFLGMKFNLAVKMLTPAILGVLAFSSAFAQRGVPAAYRADYNRMMSNMSMQQMNMFRNMPVYALYDSEFPGNDQYDFTVNLKDGSVMIVHSRIYPDSVKHSDYLLLVNKNLPKTDSNRKQKIYVTQTNGISRVDDYGITVKGLPNDSCWLFKMIDGKIKAYSFVSAMEDKSSVVLCAFQVGDGPLQNFSVAVLYPILKSDERAYKVFQNKRYFRAIELYNKNNP